MKQQYQNRIRTLEGQVQNLQTIHRTAQQKYLELNHAHGQIINSAVPKLRKIRVRLYLSILANIAFISLTIYLALRKP